jgi:acetaldehyde dehydrogenase (acetylating)
VSSVLHQLHCTEICSVSIEKKVGPGPRAGLDVMEKTKSRPVENTTTVVHPETTHFIDRGNIVYS